MQKALRKSTLKQRKVQDSSKGKIELKVLFKRKRKSETQAKGERRARSLQLQDQISENQEIIQQEIERLSSLLSTFEGNPRSSSSSSSESVFDTPVSSPSASQLGSSASLAWDNQVDLESPLKDTSDLLDTTFGFLDDNELEAPPALSRERSASVSVNRASYVSHESGQIIDLQPVCRSLNRQFENPEPSEAIGLISQDSFLERNLQAKEVEALRIIDEGNENSFDDLDVDSLDFAKKGISTKMEETAYKQKLKRIKEGYRRVLDKISGYTSEDVSEVDKDEYKEQLKSTRARYEAFIEEVNTVIDLLDEDVEQVRVEEVNKFKLDATAAVKKNEKDVKARAAAVMAEFEANKPLTKLEKKTDELKILKIQKRIGFIKEKSVEVKNNVLKVKKTKDMTDNEVREFISESKEWDKAVKEIVKSKEIVEEDSVGLDLDPKEISDLKGVVQNAVDALSNKIENLKLEDKSRGLFSAVSKNLSRMNTVFPDAFAGELGENVYKFKDKFMQAIHDSQVRDKDQVEVLRKHLTGEAKKLVGDHHKDLDSALKALVDHFGDPTKIWKSCKEDAKKKLGGNFAECWGFYGDQKRVLAIAAAIEFLREASELAVNYSKLTNEVYHSSTFEFLMELFPRDYLEKFNDIVEQDEDTFKKRIENVLKFLEERKKSAMGAVDIISKGKKDTTRKPPLGETLKRSAAYGNRDEKRGGTTSSDCEICGGSECQTLWHGIGCVEIYKLKTRDERLGWLRKHKRCFKCGSFLSRKPNQRHTCFWYTKGKLFARCTTDDCWWAAATCESHKDNLSKELMDWMKNVKINIKNLAQSIVFGHSVGGKVLDLKTNSSCCKEKDKVSSIPISDISKQERESLQLGKISRPMNDNDLVEFFEEDVKKISSNKPDVRSVPEGEPVFIMNVFKGKTRPICAFIDSGCNCWVSRSGIPEHELVSCKLRSGPIPMGVASAITVNADAEWASLLPLADGGNQVVRGLTMPEVTQEMPSINMYEVFKAIKKTNKNIKSIQNLQVPKFISGQIDMIIGIKYANLFPELIHQFPNGLAVYKSKLLPAIPGAVACIGGPVEALEGLEGVYGGHTLGYITQLTLAMKTFSPRLDFFPDDKHDALIDADIPGVDELLDLEENKDENDKISKSFDQEKLSLDITCQECGDQFPRIALQSVTVQGEFKKFMKQQEAGLDTSYKCPKCRNCDDCVKGSGFENISLKQEAEQELIKQSVTIDMEKSRPMAHLPFMHDPKEHLKDNSYAAQKRLTSVCKKYYKDEKVKLEINAAFKKLKERGHIKFYDDLNQDQKEKLDSETGYTIPWDIVWKETSLSTPARTVYDASSKTASGYSLNDILATGIPDLAKLLDVLLDWHMGPTAFVGDVSQFYCSIGLVEESWPYQKLLLREDLNPNGKMIKAVIISAIFGVCSSGGQSEEAIRKFCEMIILDFPIVVKLLLKSRYVDDILKSLKSKSEALDLIKRTDENLQKINMFIKGWGISGEKPPDQLSDDGVSIGFSGLTWYPEIDSFKLNISSLHFGKKKRGRHSLELDIYDPVKHSSVESFLKDKVVTRRKCTSVVARLFDMYGKLEPLKLRFKSDLRQLIYDNPAWDDPISSAKLVRWTENFKMIEDCRDILYVRCMVPPGAVSLKARIWILCDAADVGVMVAVYARFPLPENRWSCQNLLGKSLLPPEAWTIPKKELQGLTLAANVKIIIERALEDWIDKIFIGGDSEIALAWTIYENVKLNVFHRNRVNNIRSKVSLDQLHHVQGLENCSDIGTRPDSVKVESVMPGSEWLDGREWLRKPYEDAVADGVIKSVHDIKLTNDAKKTLKEGIIFDQFEADDSNVAVAKINTIDVKKIAEREAFSEYIYPPLKRSFRPTVRIISLVLLAVRRLKEGAIKARIRAGKADPSELDKLKPKTVKFTVFEVIGENKAKQLDENDGIELDEKPSTMFNIDGVHCTLKKGKGKKIRKKTVLIRLSDEDLSLGLEYLFKKATKEILEFENKKDIEKISVLKEEVLYCSSRILEGQDLRTVGCLSESLDLESFTGIKFCVPLISKHSPLAISLAIHLHCNVNKHRGVESTFRLSLQHARILQGRQLFKEIGDDCIFCKKLRLKYVRQLMGPLAESQLCISPIFYYTYLDMWGPLTVYCPGYEKRTRNRKQAYEVHMLVMGCVVTGAVNCQIIEKKDTGAVLDGLNRFFCETSVPKICYPDQDGALMKALSKGEISILDLQGTLHRERGILFETCLPQGHNQHGRIERRIRMLQESLDRSEIRLTHSATATGWQTIAKAIEREVNSIPLGFLHHQGTANPLLRVLRPSLLKNGTYTDRAPKGLFTIPDSAADLMTNIETIYNMWFQLWNTSYIPLVMDRSKWHLEDESLRTDDLVYFKLTDSKLAADWRLGKVEYVNIGRDGKVREIGISFKTMDDDGDWKHSVVERPVRAVVKLMNIEDTSIIENMKKVEELVKIILEKEVPVLDSKKVDVEDNDQDSIVDVEEVDGPVADDTRPTPQDLDQKVSTDKVIKPRKKRKTELERLLEDNIFKISPEERRSAAEKNKYFAPTEDEYITTNFYVNTVMCFYKSNPNNAVNLNTYSVSRFHGDQVGVTTAAIQSGVTGLLAAGGHVWASHGGQVDSGQVEVEGVSCTEDLNDYSMYLL